MLQLRWWLKHLKNANKSLQDLPVNCKIQADASEQRQGDTHRNSQTGER